MISEAATLCTAMGCCISARAPATVNRKTKGLAPPLARDKIRIDADHRAIIKLLTDQPAKMTMRPHTFGSESLDDEFFSVMRDFSASYADVSHCSDSICRIKSPSFAETPSSYHPREETRLTEQNEHKPAGLFRASVPSPLHLTTDTGWRSIPSEDRNSIQPRNEMKLADYFPDSYWLKETVADPR